MKAINLIFVLLLINSILCEMYKGIESKCTKKLMGENIDGTLACIREEHEIFIPYLQVKAYSEAIKNNDCQKANELFKSFSAAYKDGDDQKIATSITTELVPFFTKFGKIAEAFAEEA
jgi:hypothetical protein